MSAPVFTPFVDETLYVYFDTFDGGTGASITMTGLAVTDIEIYKDGSVTQRSSDAGITLLDTDGIDFDGITGIHGFSIDLSDNTDAGFYADGSSYVVVVSSVTVDAQTVSFIAAHFTIRPVVAVANVTQWLGTAAATPATAGYPAVTIKDGTGTGEIALTAGAIDNVTLAATVTTLTGHTAQTGDSFARIGANGASLTALPWNAAWDAEVESEVNDAIDTAISELGVAAPTATPTLRTGMMLMYMALRNKLVVQTSGTDAIEIYNDAGTKIASKAITDDGSDYTEAEMA